MKLLLNVYFWTETSGMCHVILLDDWCFQMNSLKDLYLLLEEENLTSPTHHTDKRTPADEQPLSPTIKVGGVPRISHEMQTYYTYTHTHTYKPQSACDPSLPPAVQRREQHPGRPEGGAAGPERRAAAGEAGLSGAHAAVRKGQGIVGSGEDRAAEPYHAGRGRRC